MIKYLGSKRRLVPVLGEVLTAVGASTAIDMFTGTTRVAQEFKRRGADVTAVDTATYAEVLARCWIATDADTVEDEDLSGAIARLDALPGRAGYFTRTFCEQARFLRPENGARVDAIRDEIDRSFADDPLRPILLTALLLAADRVDSTTGVQMAYLKSWSPRSARPLRLEVPTLIPGPGRAVRGDAVHLAATLPPADLAYLDPPYNQHRYFTNYHVWETLVRWDRPEHYGVVNKRLDARDPSTRTDFDSRRTMPAALAGVIASTDCRLLVVSGNDEGWVSLDDLRDMCAHRGETAVLAFDSRRYVGAQIGVYNRAGERVGAAGRRHNTEYLVVSGAAGDVRRAVAAAGSPAGG